MSIEIGNIEHILINSQYVTVQFTNFFNGGKFTKKRLRALINDCDQDILNVTVHKSILDKFKKSIKGLQYGVKSVTKDGNLINIELKNVGWIYTNYDNRFQLLEEIEI